MDSDMEQESTGVAIVEAEVLDVEVSNRATPYRVAVETAKAHPRSIDLFRNELGALATLDEKSAKMMFYGLKRGGKMIEGPSIRFAECVAHSFGNLQLFGRVVDVGATTLKAEGGAWDLEKNQQIVKEVERRITDKDGHRYNQDMITVTGNAAVSIAIRNAIMHICPRPWWAAAFEGALETAAGKAKTFKARRADWLAWWKEQGGVEAQLWAYLEVEGWDDVSGKQIRILQGLRNAVEEGTTTFQREMDILAGEDIPEEEAASLDAELLKDD